jgi:predicted acylesterase/phospholipase RssA
MTYLDVDTLLISGGGLNSMSILGCLKYLIENDFVDSKLDIFKNIIGVSGGLIHILPIIVGYTLEETIHFYTKVNINDYLNDKISLRFILDNYGIHDVSILNKVSKLILKHKNISENLTLSELYKLTKKNILFKTINITTEKILFVNHINYPDLPLSTAICMTSCAPILFKPVEYKGDLYIDGGFCGNFPYDIEKRYKKYLGINVVLNNLQRNTLRKNSKDENIVHNFADYFKLIFKLSGTQVRDFDIKKRIITINISGSGLNFKEKNNEKHKIINEGYIQTNKHFKSMIA